MFTVRVQTLLHFVNIKTLKLRTRQKMYARAKAQPQYN